LAAFFLLGLALTIAYGTGHGGLQAATFALSAVAAFAGVAALRGNRRRDRDEGQATRDLRELVEIQQQRLTDAEERQPDPEVLFLIQGEGVRSGRIERRRPRSLDIEDVVAHERTLALRTLPDVVAPVGEGAVGSLNLHRQPSEQSRNDFREKVDGYASSLRKALEQYDAYRKERALLVNGRFRFQNRGRRPAHHVTVLARFPDPFEVVRDWPERPVIPMRPAFHRDRTRLSALMGGDPRAGVPDSASSASRESVASDGNVASPKYRQGSTTVEVEVGRLPHSHSVDMEDWACWTLRLPTPGTYRILWELHAEELREPAHGELDLEVVELFDDAPIRSIKELLDEDARGTPGGTLK
jgi:hypothetical protein